MEQFFAVLFTLLVLAWLFYLEFDLLAWYSASMSLFFLSSFFHELWELNGSWCFICFLLCFLFAFLFLFLLLFLSVHWRVCFWGARRVAICITTRTTAWSFSSFLAFLSQRWPASTWRTWRRRIFSGFAVVFSLLFLFSSTAWDFLLFTIFSCFPAFF